ncbi:MAG: pentapeptide repeat-containing protein, partial [Acidobacteria bacterium]|nr:pentapeptide repeat-containing protein [Acidobacteriota bacterium]
LVHFNLLLQLQLLSRQLYAFDAAAPKEERIGGLRDRLHIFPYTYYLVGRPGPIVRKLLGIVVGITLLVLPLATLLVLQLRFLAYQDQAVTWAQRVAVWFDVALVIALWPVIMDPGDSWRDYLRQVKSYLRRYWEMGLACAALAVGVAAPFVTTRGVYVAVLVALSGLLILLDIARHLGKPRRWWRGRGREPEDAIPAASLTVRGMPGLLLVVALGVPFPLVLLTEGEWWEEKVLAGHVVASEIYHPFRRPDVREQVLLAKPKPELIAQFREGDPAKVKEALKQVEPVKLRWRSLRGANFKSALLPGADLEGAQLQGANFVEAQLQGANLIGAQLQGAELLAARLQGADLWGGRAPRRGFGESQAPGRPVVASQARGRFFVASRAPGRKFDGSTAPGRGFEGSQTPGRGFEGSQTPGRKFDGSTAPGRGF